MKPSIEHIDALIAAAKELKRAQQSFEKKSARARDVDLSMSHKAISKATADMHWDGMHVERCWDTLHASAVDLGLCDAKTAEEYEVRTVSWSGFHEQQYQPAKPGSVDLDHSIVFEAAGRYATEIHGGFHFESDGQLMAFVRQLVRVGIVTKERT